MLYKQIRRVPSKGDSFGSARGSSRIPWVPGDEGHPTAADTKEELQKYLEIRACRAAPLCINKVTPGISKRNEVYIRHMEKWCRRCDHLWRHHNLRLSGLIRYWEQTGEKCWFCGGPIPSPINGLNRLYAIDHDYKICDVKGHSCEKCRRGLAHSRCNSTLIPIWDGRQESEPVVRTVISIIPELARMNLTWTGFTSAKDLISTLAGIELPDVGWDTIIVDARPGVPGCTERDYECSQTSTKLILGLCVTHYKRRYRRERINGDHI